jgi:hypothetical protein
LRQLARCAKRRSSKRKRNSTHFVTLSRGRRRVSASQG